MPAYVLIVDVLGLSAAVLGFLLAFRQSTMRPILGLPLPSSLSNDANDDEPDPLTYIFRIAGVMAMVFGLVIAGMVTMFYLG